MNVLVAFSPEELTAIRLSLKVAFWAMTASLPVGILVAIYTSEFAGPRSGYAIRYVIVGASTVGAPARYELAATPQQYGRTGRRSFFRDSKGELHAADRRGAVGSEADPKLE